MSKKTKVGLIIIVIFIVCVISSILLINLRKSKETLYFATYYFGFGSRRTIIYTNGDVYEDVEIEDPNHKPDYKYLKTLTEKELKELLYILENESDEKKIKEDITELVYGVKEFDNMGRYHYINLTK